MINKGTNIQIGSGGILGDVQYDFSVNSHNIIGIGNNIDTVNTYEQEQNLAAAAAEIQNLLEQLGQYYPMTVTSETMLVAAEVIRQIENNPQMYQRVLSAFKAAGGKTLEQAIAHPIAPFLIGAIQAWITQAENSPAKSSIDPC
jgi:hypothetical protein